MPGLVNGRLAPPPAKPNCVSSESDASGGHSIDPLTFEGDAASAMDRIKAIMGKVPRARLEKEADGYLHYVVITAIMRYRDDVEFRIDGNTIHFRSASRLGHSDLGVNRKRMEAFRAAWDALG